MAAIERPEIFQVGKVNPDYTVHESYPIRLGKKDSCISFQNYIQMLGEQGDNLSMDPYRKFTFHNSSTPYYLSDFETQKSFHRGLREEGFDFSRSPFSLQKWDEVTERWNLLTIDCQLMAANYLVYLNRNLTGCFEDRVHTHQKLAFRTREVWQGGYKCVEVTPVLEEQDKKDVHLKLTITSKVRFANLKITAPATMATASPDFECCICFDGINDKTNEKIFQTGCGPGHCFHARCIDRWFKTAGSSCPVCRTSIRYK